jgi:histidinol-phosphate aminotransferase
LARLYRKNRIINLIRDDVRRLKAYEAPEISCEVKLDAHENPYPLPGKIREKVLKALSPVFLNRYPDSGAKELKKIIATQFGVKVENIMLGNGSDELIQAIIAAFGGSPGKVLYPVPTFSMYRIISKSLGQIPIEVPLEKDFDLDIASMLSSIKKERPGVIFLSYPNNPTGNFFSREKIIEIIEKAEAAVVLDEAYFDFSKRTFLPLLKKYENLIILRSLSKIGLAGLRVGVLIARPEVVKEINKVRLPYNVNSLSQAVARVVLENRKEIDRQIKEIIKERERLYKELLGINGIKPFPTEANFILFRTSKSADKVYQGLINNGVLIRNMNQSTGSFGKGLLSNCLRVTIGTPEENRFFLNALKGVINCAKT